MVKLKSIVIENIKNVQYGVIDFQNKSDFIPNIITLWDF